MCMPAIGKQVTVNTITLSFGQKLWLAFALVGILGMSALLVVRYGILAIESYVNELLYIYEPLHNAAYEMEINTIGTGLGVMKYIQTGKQHFQERVKKDQDDFQRFQRQFEQLADNETLLESTEQVKQLYSEYHRLAESIMVRYDLYQEHLANLVNNATRLQALIREQPLLAESSHSINEPYLQALHSFEATIYKSILLSTHTDYLTKILNSSEQGIQHAGNLPAIYAHLGEIIGQDDRLWALFENLQASLRKSLDEWRQLGQDLDRFILLRTRLDDLLDEELQVLSEQRQAEAAQTLQNAIRKTDKILWTFILLFLTTALASGYYLINRSRHALQSLASSAGLLAEGDFRNRLPLTEDTEFQQVAQAFNDMAARLAQLTMWRPHVISLIDSLNEALFLVKPDGRIQLANPAAHNISDYALGDLVGLSFEQVFQDRRRYSLTEGETSRQTGIILTSKNHRVPIDYTVSRLRGTQKQVEGLIYTVSDARDRLATEERLRSLAYQDPLTGLANRALLQKRLQAAVLVVQQFGQYVGLIYLDIDFFKSINDMHGHHIGDQVLRLLGQRLRDSVRDLDTVARVGGDEFNVLIERLPGPSDLTEIALAIIQRLRAPIQIDEIQLSTTVSIGAALSSADSTPSSLIHNADSALRQAKALGKNRYQLYDSNLSARDAERRQLTRELRQARVNRQFVLYYQPQVRCDSGEIYAIEALIRWQHPRRGVLSPADFLPIAEDSGLIHELTSWAVTNACYQFKQLLAQGAQLQHVAVNIPARLLVSDHIVVFVKDALMQTELDPAQLELEITEDALQTGPPALTSLGALADLGVRIALDDFGTGYSSFGSLKDLPIQVVKIDRSFISDLPHSTRSLSIVTAMLSMLQNLGTATLAEGVETEAQLALLQELGCDAIQGYLFSKPVSFCELQKLLRESCKKRRVLN